MRSSLTLSIPTDFQMESRQIPTPRSPFGSEELLIKMENMREMCQSLKNNSVTIEQLMENLSSKSIVLKRRKSLCQIYRAKDIPKQIESINKIKQENQRILKGRIRYLEQRVKKNQFQRPNSEQKLLVELEQKLQQKKRLLEKKQQSEKKQKMENKRLEEENFRLLQQIQQLKRVNLNSKMLKPVSLRNQHVQTNPPSCVDSWVQSEQQIYYYDHKITQTQNFGAGAFEICSIIDFKILPQQNKEVQMLKLAVDVLQISNSCLRKQLVKIHSYMDEQDEKHRQKLQRLQQKIRRLTTFDELKQSRYQILESSYSRWESALRKSDIGFSTGMHKQKMSSSQIVQVADVKLKLELSRRSSPKKVREQDSKATIASVLSESKQ